MKGQGETTEIFSILGIIVVLIALIPVIVPTIQEAIKMFTLDSPEIVSKDLAGLISISAAAQENILIRYSTISGNTYDVNVGNKLITMSRELSSGKQESSSPIPIDAKGSFTSVKDFIIEKRVEDEEEKYFINGQLIFSTGNIIPTPGQNPPNSPSPDMCSGAFLAFTPKDCGADKIDLLEYYIPDSPVTIEIEHSSGQKEYFHTYLFSYENEKGVFYITKSRDPIYFEEFKFDENYVYHQKDTTWATGPNQNVKCDNGDDAYFTTINGLYGQDNCNIYTPENDGGILHARCMSVGETSGPFPLTIVGFSKKTCKCCKTPYNGNMQESVTLVSRGSVTFPTGWSSDDVIKLYKSTTGETYYYDKKLGWVGFESSNDKAYIKNALSETHCAKLQCNIA